ncbi:MAG: ATP-binding protein [Bacteroidales bacterium]
MIQGNGLGLNIVRESVRLQGGEVTFESTPEKGSTFFIHIYDSNLYN